MENNVTFNMMYSAIVALTVALEANTAALQAKPVDVAEGNKPKRKSKAVEQPVEPETVDVVEAVVPETVEQPVEPETVEQPVEPETVEQPVEPETVEQPVEPETVEQPVEPETVEQPVEPEPEGVTIKDVETALLEVKNKHGSDAAKRIVVEVGGVTTIKKADPIKYQAMIDACEVLMTEDVNAAPEPEVNEPVITVSDLKAKATELAKAMGSADKAKQLIAQYGVKKTDELDPKDYAKLFADLETALAALQEGDL